MKKVLLITVLALGLIACVTTHNAKSSATGSIVKTQIMTTKIDPGDGRP